MMRFPAAAIAAIACIGAAPALAEAPEAGPSCVHGPGFAALIAPAAARRADTLDRLYAYAAGPAGDNPDACEAMDVDALIAVRERAAVALVTPTGVLPAAQAFRCATFDRRTARCNGLVEDGTAQPDAIGRNPPPPAHATIRSRLHHARLVGLYRTTIGAALDGRPVTPLPVATRLTLARVPPATVLIAMFDAPAPYRYRKLVWYFR